ncbi:rCG49138 [Rattus norvegicus]|uniref:RCG49138 n=1 Tax=Rattus norvegicus TaxID=10116 RepID=A6IGL4_RAT|nr:rCG49138 [Rattus norvegicus]
MAAAIQLWSRYLSLISVIASSWCEALVCLR